MQRAGLTMLITVLLLSATVICAAFLFGTHANRINVRNPKSLGSPAVIAPLRHDAICRFGMAVMCPLMMSLHYCAGSVIRIRTGQPALKLRARRADRECAAHLAACVVPSVPRSTGYYGCAAAPYRRYAKYAKRQKRR